MEKELILREILTQNKHWKDEKEFFGEKNTIENSFLSC